ncbi:beta-class carbonic anhydrase [Anaerovorax sp. IOR16]|uniref:beta-class carbonic anhydrase n=1 Tax=Anaerovorax sp. IOR16 TaxID=2773458 RepID=UPI0019D16C9D|nr:carbonic anhydrase [Anaerovorax sp. IOR16]
MLKEMLEHNKAFVAEERYKEYQTDKYPSKKTAILACMDTRLTALLPAALGLKNGDVKLIKNAGAVVSHPYGSVIHSLIVAIYELGVEEILVIGHDDCGMQNINSENLIQKMHEHGITDVDIARSDGATGGIQEWLVGFCNVEDAVNGSVEIIKTHPLIPKDVRIYGLIMNPETGEVRQVC